MAWHDNATIKRIDACRICGRNELVDLFSLGEQWVNDFVDKDQIESGVKCPIEIVMCPTCTLVQQRYTAPQELLYTKHYWYRSGVTQTMRDALRDVTAKAEELVDLKPGDVVLDIGSNDGTLLRSYSKPGLVRVGVEPAENMETYYKGTGKPWLIKGLWGDPNTRNELVDRCSTNPKVVTACGMFYDLDDPNSFIADVAKVLHPDGLFIAQLQCLRNTINVGDVGNFCHEHLEFYSLKSLDFLLGKHGLETFDIETNSVNGQSYRLYIQHKGGQRRISNRLMQAHHEEICLDQPEFYGPIFAHMEANKNLCVKFVTDAVKNGKRVWVYGASTKGNVVLQWYGLDRKLIEGAAERSPEKFNKYTIGTGILIVPECEFRDENPDYAVVLPYAFLNEFMARESEWRKRGGKFIVPLPKFKVV